MADEPNEQPDAIEEDEADVEGHSVDLPETESTLPPRDEDDRGINC